MFVSLIHQQSSIMTSVEHVDKSRRTSSYESKRGLFESALVNESISKYLQLSDRRSFHKTGKQRLLGDIGVTPHPELRPYTQHVVKLPGEKVDPLFYKYGDCCYKVSKDCLQQAILALHAEALPLLARIKGLGIDGKKFHMLGLAPDVKTYGVCCKVLKINELARHQSTVRQRLQFLGSLRTLKLRNSMDWCEVNWPQLSYQEVRHFVSYVRDHRTIPVLLQLGHNLQFQLYDHRFATVLGAVRHSSAVSLLQQMRDYRLDDMNKVYKLLRYVRCDESLQVLIDCGIPVMDLDMDDVDVHLDDNWLTIWESLLKRGNKQFDLIDLLFRCDHPPEDMIPLLSKYGIFNNLSMHSIVQSFKLRSIPAPVTILDQLVAVGLDHSTMTLEDVHYILHNLFDAEIDEDDEPQTAVWQEVLCILDLNSTSFLGSLRSVR